MLNEKYATEIAAGWNVKYHEDHNRMVWFLSGMEDGMYRKRPMGIINMRTAYPSLY